MNETDRYTLTADDDWESIFPEGHGFVHLGPSDRPFALSMYHQFHCLAIIRHLLVSCIIYSQISENSSEIDMNAR